MRQALRCVLLGIALCSPADLNAKTELLKTRPGSVVHWARPTITIGVDVSARSRSVESDDVAKTIEGAMETWNAIEAQQPKLRLLNHGQPDVMLRFCRGRWRGETIDLGKSSFTASLHDGTVTAATVEINECDHAFAPRGRHEAAAYDLQAVLTHELGHVLGLGHSDDHAAIMFPSGGGPRVRPPSLEDQTALALIYFGRFAIEPAMRDAASQQPGDGAGAAVDASLHAPPAPTRLVAEHRNPASAPPPDSISLLSLRAPGGGNIMVYTCEPTLLPALDIAPQVGRKHSVSGRYLKGVRTDLHAARAR